MVVVVVAVSAVAIYPSRKGGVHNGNCLIVIFVLQTFTPCLPTVKKWFKNAHSDVYRIETTIKYDINVSITPPFLQG
jgi:hypothetical protein